MIKKIFLFILLATATFGQNLYVETSESSTKTVIVSGNYTRNELEFRVYGTNGVTILMTKLNSYAGGTDISTTYRTPYTHCKVYFSLSDLELLDDSSAYPYILLDTEVGSVTIASGYVLTDSVVVSEFFSGGGGIFDTTYVYQVTDSIAEDVATKFDASTFSSTAKGSPVANDKLIIQDITDASVKTISLSALPVSTATRTDLDSLAEDIADLVSGSAYAAYSTYTTSILDSRTGLYHGGNKYLILGEDISQAVGGDVTVSGEMSASSLVGSTLDVSTSAALPDSFTIQGTTLLPSGTELNYVDGVTSGIQSQLNTRTTVADSLASDIAAISDSVDLKLYADFDNSFAYAAPTGLDEMVYQLEDEDVIKRTALADLPVSDATSNLIDGKANLNSVNIVSGDTIPSYYTFYQSYIDTLNHLIARLSPEIIPSPNPPTNLAVVAGNGATADIVLTWTAPTGEFDSIAVEANIANAGWSVLAYVDTGVTQTYTHSSQTAGVTIYYRLRAINTATPVYSNYTDPVPGTVTNIDYGLWYVSNADIGTGTGLSWANAMAFNDFLDSGNPDPGDTVYIDGGVSSMDYSTGNSNDSYVFGSNMSGSASGKVIFTRGIDASHSGTPTFINPGASAWGTIQFNNVDYIEISHIKVDPGVGGKWCFAGSNDGSTISNIDILYDSIMITAYAGFDMKRYNYLTIMHNTFTTGGVVTGSVDNDAFWGDPGSNLEFAYNTVYNGCNSTNSTYHRDILQLNNQNASGGYTKIHHNFIYANGTTTGIESNSSNAGTWLIYNNVWSLASLYNGSDYGGGYNINMIASTSSIACSLLIYNDVMIGGQVALDVNNVDYIEVKNTLLRPAVGIKKVSELTNMPTDANQVFNYNLYEGTYEGFGGNNWATWIAAGHDANSHYGTTTNSIFELLNASSTSLSAYAFDDASPYGIDDGTDLSAIGTYQFSDDINGTARGTWDRGALVK